MAAQRESSASERAEDVNNSCDGTCVCVCVCVAKDARESRGCERAVVATAHRHGTHSAHYHHSGSGEPRLRYRLLASFNVVPHKRSEHVEHTVGARAELGS